MNVLCKACGAEITKPRVNKYSGEEESLCSECLSSALAAAYDIEEDYDPDDLIDMIEKF